VRVKYAARLTRSTARIASPRPGAAVLVAVLAFGGPAAVAHQAPDLDTVNRYLKVTLLPGKARVTHTFLFGDRPGAAARRLMDTSGDGTLDANERNAFAARVLDLAPRVAIAGGAPARGWRVADVGVGEPPRTAGGAFAIDLVLELPYPDPTAAEQRLVIDDAAAVPDAGETELRIDESPGVRVLEAHLVTESAGIELRYASRGNAAVPGERAVSVRFQVDEPLRPQPARWPWLAGAAVAVAGTALALAWRARHRRRRA
jgi:hypothetical protein